jgi:hypothetical protein
MADLILLLHALYVLGVVVPIPLILLGAWRGWRFVRNRWFRRAHVGMIGIVVVETLWQIACPLTVLEAWFRDRMAPEVSTPSFLARWVSRWLYYNWPPAVFTALYLATGAVVVVLYVLVPPANDENENDTIHA